MKEKINLFFVDKYWYWKCFNKSIAHTHLWETPFLVDIIPETKPLQHCIRFSEHCFASLFETLAKLYSKKVRVLENF
jgi:hypothetical protein